MLGWLYRMIIGRFSRCEHKWETADTATLSGGHGARGVRYILRCERCGDIKKRDII